MPQSSLIFYAVTFGLAACFILVLEIVYAFPNGDYRGLGLVALPALASVYFATKLMRRRHG